MKEKKQYQPIECKHCGQKFTPVRKWHIYCCTSCRVLAFYERQTKTDLEKRVERLEEQSRASQEQTNKDKEVTGEEVKT